jgi:hypothetical protein
VKSKKPHITLVDLLLELPDSDPFEPDPDMYNLSNASTAPSKPTLPTTTPSELMLTALNTYGVCLEVIHSYLACRGVVTFRRETWGQLGTLHRISDVLMAMHKAEPHTHIFMLFVLPRHRSN